jgi:hypothetical protein
MNELTRNQDIMINRPASAPPSLEFSNTPFQNNAFLFETGVVDIRESPQYEKFYHNNLSKHLLPPPFQSDFLPGGTNSTERANVSEHFVDQLLPTINIQSSQPSMSYLKSPRLDGLRDEKFIKVSPKVTPRGMSSVQKSTSPGVTPRKIEPQSAQQPQQQSPITSSPRREGSPNNNSNTSPIGSPVRMGSPTSSLAKAENTFLSLQPGGKLESLALSPRGFSQLSSAIGGSKSILNDKIFPTELEITKDLSTLSMVESLSTPSSPHPVETIPQGFQICKYFLNGFCARGDTCNFMHEPNFPSPYANKNPLNAQMIPSGKKMNTRNTNKAGRFSASHYENVEIKDCIGQICFICKDQQGCRFLQREIDKSGSHVVDIIFAEVITHVNELIDDPFGNYLVQKLIDVVSKEQRFLILAEVRHDLVNISKNIHGTRASQKLIELLDSSEEVEIVRAAFMEHIVDLIEDLNGNHVVQKCLIKLNSEDNQFIYDGITQNLVSVATLRHGCCVLQRCFDFGTIEQQQQLIDQILANATILVEDSFGNYVLQYILDIDFPDLAIQLINQFEGEIFRMSKEKCSSNVIEKCMKSRNPICTQRVMRELLSLSNDPSSLGAPLHKPEVQQSIVQSNLYELLQDPFGNYVLQTCLAEGAIKCPTEYVTMVQLISPFVQKLQQNSNTNKKISQLLNFSNNMSIDQQSNRQDKDSRQNYNNNNLQQQQHGGNKNNNNYNNNNNNNNNMNNQNQNYNNNMMNNNPGNNPNYYFIPNMPGMPGNYINFVPNGAYLPNNGNFGQPQFGNFHNNNAGNNNYNLGPINPNYNPKMNPNANKNKMMMMDPNVGSVHLNPLHKINSYDNVDNSRDTVISASPQISLVYPSYASTNQQNNDRMGNGRMNTKNTGQKQNSNSGNNNANNRNNNSNNNNNNNNNMGVQQQQQQQQQQLQQNKKRNNMNTNPVHNQKQQV